MRRYLRSTGLGFEDGKIKGARPIIASELPEYAGGSPLLDGQLLIRQEKCQFLLIGPLSSVLYLRLKYVRVRYRFVY